MLPEEEKQKIAKKGRKLVLNDYNMVTNFTNAIKRILLNERDQKNN